MSALVGEAMTGGYGGADILHDCTIGVDNGEIAVIVGILGVFAAPALGEALGYEGIEAKVGAASAYLIGCVLIFGPITLFAAPDDREATAGAPITFDEVRTFLVRRDFLWMSTANFATNFATVSLSVITYFIAAYLFEAPDRYGLAMTLYFVAAFLGMPAWMALARRLGDARRTGIRNGLAGGSRPRRHRRSSR